MKPNHDPIAAHAYSLIVQETSELMDALDAYRAAGDTPEKQKRLFAVRSREAKIRKMLIQEYKRQNPPQLKLKIA